jgi:hypothetical protein
MYLKNTLFAKMSVSVHCVGKLICFNLLVTISDNKMMKLSGEYLTIPEIAKELEITYLTAKQRLLRSGIKPTAKDAIYPRSVLEAIRSVPSKGRPKKATTEKPASKGKK